jgi:hypothetical protein
VGIVTALGTAVVINAMTNNLQENEISVFAETGTDSDNSKVYIKKHNSSKI